MARSPSRGVGSPALIHGHASTWHDGGAAILLPDGEIVAISSERIGERQKHAWDSRVAYDFLRPLVADELRGAHVLDRFVDQRDGLTTRGHHEAHAALALAASGWDDAAILVIDGHGCEADVLQTTTIWRARGREVELIESLCEGKGEFATSSVGHFYTAIGALAGMQDLHEEGKTMALAAYGRPSPYLDLFRRYVKTYEDGTYAIDGDLTMGALTPTLGTTLFGWDPAKLTPGAQRAWGEFLELRGRPIRKRGEAPTQDDMDVAFAGQRLVEEIVVGLARRATRSAKSRRLAFAGGVALNCVANGRILREGAADELCVPFAPGDEGQALGKALAHASKLGLRIKPFNAYLGVDPAPTSRPLTRLASPERSIEHCAALLDQGALVGVCRGRSELGPRALGHRSLLADPRRGESRARLNLAKGREPYRPVAPMVLAERAPAWFELSQPSPWMTIAALVRPEQRARVPAIVHVDGTARVQTVAEHDEPWLHALLTAFEARTSVPILVNTSFNGPGEPIVQTEDEAVRAAERMGLDAIALTGGIFAIP